MCVCWRVAAQLLYGRRSGYGMCDVCDEPTPFVLDVRLLASCSRMQLLDGRRLRYGVSFHGNVVQFAVFASGGPLGYRAGHSDENRSGLRRRALV